jgi:ATP-dependent RNA helicase DeaD
LVEPRERWLLQNIERLTKSRIEMASLPTVADLQAKRLERIGVSIQEILKANNFDTFRTVVNTLTENFDPADVAAAAVQLAYGSKAGERMEEEIPAIRDRAQEAAQVSRRPRREPPSWSQGTKTGGSPGRPVGRRERPVRSGQSTNMATLHFSAGKNASIRPGDFVGAIANEAGINSNVIGPIKISDDFSLVKVPEELAQNIMKVLGRTRIKGKKVKVRLHRE